jgi:predicted PurR-regulated permease PerM
MFMASTRGSRPITRDDLMLAVLAAALLALLWAVRGVAILVAFALLLAYALDPLVTALARIPLPGAWRLPRPVAAFLVIAVLVGLIAWLLVIATPVLVSELTGFLGRVPGLIGSLTSYLHERLARAGGDPEVQRAVDSLRTGATSLLPQLAAAGLKWLGLLFSRAEQVVGLAVLPILAFYLLADSDRVRESLFRLLPESARDSTRAAAPAVDRALKSYVRGQALVCLAMGVGTGAMLAIAHVPNAFFLGVLAGLAEILPLVGAIVATIAIALSGLTLDLWHAVLGLALYSVNNWVLGTFVTPRVMERYLEIHPFVVIVSVLTGAALLGPAGALLALPIAAVTQALIEDGAKQPTH